jgi:5-methylcytosine-specific restriction endonuclease McrA
VQATERQIAAAQRVVADAQTLLRSLLLAAVVDRDGACCHYCQVPTIVDPEPAQRFCERTLDHVVPLSRGGAETLANVVLACRSCNSRKGTRPQYQYVRGGAR